MLIFECFVVDAAFCLQSEAPCLQLSFYAYKCFGSFLTYNWSSWAYNWTFFAYNQSLFYLNGLYGEKLNCKQRSSNCKEEGFPPCL